MRHGRFIVISLASVLACSCGKSEAEPVQEPERELSIPERLEAELMDIAGRGWTELIDTLTYFHTNFLSQGKLRGTGPDGVYYELKLTPQHDSLACISFYIADSLHLKAIGKTSPLKLTVYACNTKLLAQVAGVDSLSLDADNLGATLPFTFSTDSLATAPLRFEGSKVGWLTLDEFENENHITDRYLVVHYFDDSRTFAYNGESLL